MSSAFFFAKFSKKFALIIIYILKFRPNPNLDIFGKWDKKVVDKHISLCYNGNIKFKQRR
ncbi:MAG TPA: hypothetical protein DHW16_02965 [Ruminococcaceae bacterium]|nr:hypothetical protein [Oscillospiraceae bacterium]HCO37281.1 hypothetical protein [Oscillospiraceae bacterium]